MNTFEHLPQHGLEGGQEHSEQHQDNPETTSNTLRSLDEFEPEAADVLRREFDLEEFGRYPIEALRAMYREKDSDGDWGLMIYAKDDYNGAFMHQGPARELYESVAATHHLRIVECESLDDIKSQLARLGAKYGPASFAVVNAHGSPETLRFGEDEKKGVVKRTGAVDKKELGDALDGILKPGAEVCLAACSTGVEAGIGQVVSDETGHDVHGPDDDAALQSYGAVIKGDSVSFSPRYSGADSNELTPR